VSGGSEATTTTTTTQHPDSSVSAPATIDTRLKISALWVAVLFVVAAVDLLSMYQADVQAEIDAGEIGGFEVGAMFLLGAMLFYVIPAVMIYLTLVMRPGLNRRANTIAPALCALACIGSAIGESGHYLVGTAVETALLVAAVYHARTIRS